MQNVSLVLIVYVCLVQVTHTEETLASNTWSLMLKEVLGSLLKAPEGLFSGLTLLSELLPLPLPMQSTQVSHSILLVIIHPPLPFTF